MKLTLSIKAEYPTGEFESHIEQEFLNIPDQETLNAFLKEKMGELTNGKEPKAQETELQEPNIRDLPKRRKDTTN